MDLLDWIAPLITDLLVDMVQPTGTGSYGGDWGEDYYHLQQNSSVYSKLGFEAIQPLCPFGMLQWIWDGAGLRWNGSQLVPNIEPYTIPDLQGGIDWLADHGFTIEFILKNLQNIFDMFLLEENNTTGVNLAGDLASVFSVDSIVKMVDAIEEYMRIVVAQNPDGSPNRTKAAMIALGILGDMIKILDIYPVKAIRGIINYLMPRLSAGEGAPSSVSDINQLNIGTFLEESGLVDIIFQNFSKLADLSFPLTIHQSSIDLYLFGQLIEDVPLNIETELDLATLFGGEENGEDGAASTTDMLNELPISFPGGGFPYIELSTFNGPFNISFHLFNMSLGGGETPVRYTNVTIGEVWYNETTGVYIFNRTQSSDEYENGISGWTDYKNGIPRTYVRPNSLKRSDSDGMVNYVSIIEEDEFGWVDPFIYIHVEPPNEYLGQDFYWWNVTCYPVQRTLANNTPPYKARWVDDGANILVQSTNTLPSSIINIDNDSFSEIFARVEIDGRNMRTHDVIYIEVGSILDVQIFNETGGTGLIQINASYSEITQDYNIYALRDRTKYILNEEITPTGKTITYPTISQVISGFKLQTAHWDDDSIYNLLIDYIDLNGTLRNLYTFQLNRTLGDDSYNATYPNEPTGFRWIESLAGSAMKSLTLKFAPEYNAEFFGDYKYSNINIDATNFNNKTIKSVTLDFNVTHQPPGNSSEITRVISEEFLYTEPSTNPTYYFHADVTTSNIKIQGFNSTGECDLKTKKATSAWINYTIPIPTNAFLNGIDWYIRAEEAVNSSMADSTTNVSQVIIQFYNASSNEWITLLNHIPSSVVQNHRPESVNAKYTGTYLYDWADLINNLNSPYGDGKINGSYDLYLTARNRSLFESITKIKFAALIKESPSIYANDGIGYHNNSRIFNTSAWISFRFYQFINSWGQGKIEVPEGFVSNFTVTIEMYDPLIHIAEINPTDYPKVSVSYDLLGPLKHDATYTSPENETFFARKIILYLEAWDSLVRQHGDHGDVLFKDNKTQYPKNVEPLSQSPVLNTSISVIDLEAKVYINVTIDAGQILRNYYLKMNISPALGYEGRGYTDNYRFSIGTDPDTGNFLAISKIGAYPSKKVLKWSEWGFPTSMQVGIVDLEPFSTFYYLGYVLTFQVSPAFLLNTSAKEKFYFSAVWEKAEGTYEIRADKNEKPIPARVIEIVYK